MPHVMRAGASVVCCCPTVRMLGLEESSARSCTMRPAGWRLAGCCFVHMSRCFVHVRLTDGQFAAAKYYRLAEKAGNKTLGNTW